MTLPSLVTTPRPHRKHVLVIEDNAPDAMLTQMVHDQVRHCSTLAIVQDGNSALRYIRGEGEFAGEPRPDLIMLDLKMPGQTGFELLQKIRKVPGYEVVPVVICSGSDNPAEIRRAYELGANGVVRKPGDLKEFFRVIGTCYEFWCTAAVLPDISSMPAS
jgi:chemotaxis family two-component system response regulator Rcp1